VRERKVKKGNIGIMGKEISINRDINSGRESHSCESRNPGKYWIPPYRVRGKLGQARNDNPRRTSIVKYDFYLQLNPIFHHSIIPDFFFGGFE